MGQKLYYTPPAAHKPVLCANGHNDWTEADPWECVVCGEGVLEWPKSVL